VRVLSLRAENVKTLSVVEIKPDPKASTIVVSGENEAGKTSLLDAIWWAIEGSKAMPREPVKRGKSKATIKLTIGEPGDKSTVLEITRTINAKGKATLTVKDARGTRKSAPQGLLDAFYGQLTFDPIEWSRLSGTADGRKKQIEILRGLVDFDFEMAAQDRQKAYDERQIVNRELKRLQGALAELQDLADAPDAVDVSDLTAKLEEAEKVNVENERKRRMTKDQQRASEQASADLGRLKEKLEGLTGQIAEAQLEALAASERCAKMEEVTDALEDVSTAALRAQINDASEVNAMAVRHKQGTEERARLEAEADAKRKTADTLTGDINEIDHAKQKALEDAHIPVPGMTFDADGVKLDGIPFEQASSAQALKASVAMGIAVNPKLRVMLIRNGNDLDTKNRKLIAEMAEAAGAQLWIEMVESSDPAAIVLEEGALAVKEANA